MADFAIGAFSLTSSTGNQATTGVGFQPSCVLHFGCQASVGTQSSRFAFGAASSSSARFAGDIVDRDSQANMETRSSFDTADFLSACSLTADSVGQQADFVSMDSDGFTVNNKIAAAYAAGKYVAFNSATISAFVGKFTMNSGTGNQSVSGIGFKPKVVIFYTNIKNTTEGAVPDAVMSMGVAVSSTKRWCQATFCVDAAANSDTARYFDDTKCFAQISASAVTGAADFVSMDNDGFTINVTTGLACEIGYIALGGNALSASTGTFVQKTTTGNQAYTGVGFSPQLLMVMGLANAKATVEGGAIGMLGFGMSSSSRAYTNYRSNDGAGSSTSSRIGNTNLIIGDNSAATPGTVLNAADVVSMDTDGFTLNWSTTDGTAREWGYLALRIAGNVIPVNGSMDHSVAAPGLTLPVSIIPVLSLIHI